MSQPDEWTLPGPSPVCHGCGAELPPGSSVTVRLSLAQEGPSREDLCTNCGQSVGEQGDSFYWRTERPEAGSQRPVVDYALLREMFERMLPRQELSYRRLAYLVGLILVRKRHYRLKGFEAREHGEIMLLGQAGGAPDLEVPAPHLNAEDMLATREALKRLLAADLPDTESSGFEPEQPLSAIDELEESSEDADSAPARKGRGRGPDPSRAAPLDPGLN